MREKKLGGAARGAASARPPTRSTASRSRRTCWRATSPRARPDQVWVTDITFLWTAQGWLYLAVILDLFSRRVVGWATSQHVDRHLALAALDMALAERRPAQGSRPSLRSRQHVRQRATTGRPWRPEASSAA